MQNMLWVFEIRGSQVKIDQKIEKIKENKGSIEITGKT